MTVKNSTMIAMTGLALLALAAVAPGAARAEEGAPAKDTIVLTDGTERKVDKVTEENYASVKFTNAGRSDQVKSADVKEVIYADAPQSFRNGTGLMNSKKYEEAIESFEKAAKARVDGDWIKPYTLFYQAECQRLLGAFEPSRYETAADLYDTLLREVPLTRFLARALYYKGVCLRSAGKYAEADKTFQQLITEVNTKTLGERWARMADIAQARVKEAQGLYDEAYYKYNSIYELTKNSDPTVANVAQLRKGHCLLKQKKFDDAKKYFQDLEKKAEGEGALARDIRAGAAIGLGHCFMNDKEIEEARHHFLQAMVVQFSDELNPEAMYHAALCYEQLKDKEGGAELRAKIIFSDLIRRYPSSEWSQKAKEKGYKVID